MAADSSSGSFFC